MHVIHDCHSSEVYGRSDIELGWVLMVGLFDYAFSSA